MSAWSLCVGIPACFMAESAMTWYIFSGSDCPMRSSARPALKELTVADFDALHRKKPTSIPSKRSSRCVRGMRMSVKVERIRSCARSPGDISQCAGSQETFSLIYSTTPNCFITEWASVSIRGSLSLRVKPDFICNLAIYSPLFLFDIYHTLYG